MVLKAILKWWGDYKAEQKRRELYARLDRNGEGKFSMKEHRKQIEESKKKIRKNNAEKQKELKE